MSDKHALLRAIIENPDEDTPRLMYADWLEEHDDPDRAEFIRLQCRLDTTDPDDPAWEGLEDRKDDLLGLHRDQWAAFVLGRGVYRATFRRGFVEVVSATAHAFTTRGRSWCGQTPLREARLTAAAGRADRVAASSHLKVLPNLTIEDRLFGTNDLAALAASPHLDGLTGLSVSGRQGHSTLVGDRGVRALAAAPFFTQLTRLSICGCHALGSSGLTALAGAGRLTRLQELHLGHTAIDNRGALALSTSVFPALATVSLLSSRVGAEGLVALATSPGPPAMSHLGVGYGRVTGDALAALARCRIKPSLRSIGLRGNPLGRVDALAVSGLLTANPDLDLDLSMCNIPRAVQEDLLHRFRGRVTVDFSVMREHAPRISGQ